MGSPLLSRFQDPLDMPREIFRQYDIRGNASTQLTPDVCHRIARAFGELLQESGSKTPHTVSAPKVCLSFDGRLSSASLADAFVSGLLEQGIGVVFLGQGVTPFLYWAEHHLDVQAGIMITGSHNPPEDNGIKITLGKKPFYGEALQTLCDRCVSPLPLREPGKKTVTLGLQQTYVQSLALGWETAPRTSDPQPLLVVWDSGHGAAGPLLKELVEELPHASILLHEGVDGTFPARPPDPTQKGALEKLQQRVLQEEADVGFAFDGDADRVVVVDSQGQVWMGDELLVFLAEHLNAVSPTQVLRGVADIKSSPFLLERLAARGIDFSVVKTGHVHLKAAMAQGEAVLGGEVSGHFFFRDTHWGFDDGLYAALRVLHVLESSGSLEAWRAQLGNRFASPEVRLPCPDRHKALILERLAASLKQEGQTFSTLDGIKFQEEHGWWLARASQTEPFLVIRWEGKSQQAFTQMGEELLERLSQAGIEISSETREGLLPSGKVLRSML